MDTSNTNGSTEYHSSLHRMQESLCEEIEGTNNRTLAGVQNGNDRTFRRNRSGFCRPLAILSEEECPAKSVRGSVHLCNHPSSAPEIEQEHER